MQRVMVEVPSKDVLLDARAFIRFWFETKNVTTKRIKEEGNLIRTMNLDYRQYFRNYKLINQYHGPGIQKHELEDAYIEYMDIFEEGYRKDALDGFRCATASLERLKAYVEAVTGKVRELDIAVLAHWMWQVKRKSYDLPVKYTLMPILYGKQGGGKTEALHRLLKPYEEFRLNLKMNQLGDDRYYSGFAKNFIVLFDELQGIERADLNALKNQVTAITNSYRELHTHFTRTVSMKCSFIGATNKHINESFSDSTGMRRFYQMNALDILNWDVINKIDYTEMWRDIDENLKDGYLTGELLKDLAQVQTTTVNKEDVEQFIEEENLMPEGDEGAVITREEFYKFYLDWCSHAGVKKPLTRSWFMRKLVNRKMKTVDTRDAKSRLTVNFLINPKSTIGENLTRQSIGTVLQFSKQ